MTFNTVLLCGITGKALEIGPTEGTICVLDGCKTDDDLMRDMAAYTLILTKWELLDDDTDDPSLKSKLISLTLSGRGSRSSGSWNSAVTKTPTSWAAPSARG